MDSNRKKEFLEANKLFLAGHKKDAAKLWERLSESEEKAEESLHWKDKKRAVVHRDVLFRIVFFLSLLSLSFHFGHLAYLLLVALGPLISLFGNLYAVFAEMALPDIAFMGQIEQFGFMHAIDNNFPSYILVRINVIQEGILEFYVSLGLSDLSEFLETSSYFWVGFVSYFLMTAAVIGELILFFSFFSFLMQWLYRVFLNPIIRLRFFCSLAITLFVLSYFVLFFGSHLKEPISLNALNDLNLETAQQYIYYQSQKKKPQEASKTQEYFSNLWTDLSKKSMSLRERKRIIELYSDLRFIMKRLYRNSSNEGGETAARRRTEEEEKMLQKLLKLLAQGKKDEVERILKSLKAKSEYGQALGDMDFAKKENKKEAFGEVFKKLFKSSDQKALEKYNRALKDIEELYGSEVMKGIDKEKLKKGMSSDEKVARDQLRKDAKRIVQQKKGLMPSVKGGTQLPRFLNSEKIYLYQIDNIIQYLEGGGDIQVFNNMRIQFMKEVKSAELRYKLAEKISFTMASWNEHQVKYFWQMNRELMMEIVAMLRETCLDSGKDIRGHGIGWFYLVAGYYEKAREECKKTILYNQKNNRSSMVSRSNAALAALMLQKGLVAFQEYSQIQKDILSQSYLLFRKNEFYPEYIREISASLASPNPCKEAFLCRSLFLEGTNDKLALEDLFKYLATSPSNAKLISLTKQKIELLKTRIEQKK